MPRTHSVTPAARGIAMAILLALPVIASVRSTTAGGAQDTAGARPDQLFVPAAECMACHNGLTAPSGEDVSFGPAWRASMMAHSARDPYWQAAVRREILDHPRHQAEIENECSRCHMPMAHVAAQKAGHRLSIFDALAGSGAAAAPDPMAVEGVSCAVCHQITDAALGEKASFSGGFAVDTDTPLGRREVFGPYEVDRGRISLMHSASGFRPAPATHIQQSEVCATCHTLYTHPIGAQGKPLAGEFPEQMPYQEWLHSAFRSTRSCQSCHMPVVDGPTPIASVLGEPRDGVSRHDFRGANFFMLGLLNRFRRELGVVAPPAELDAAVARTKQFLQERAATVTVASLRQVGRRLEAEILVRNLGGHKLPTGYPSRRAWLHVSVRDGAGRLLFSSGEPNAAGAIAGNDNDRDAAVFEPHHREIRTPDQVQIYEAIMGDEAGAVTTGLLSAVVYLKDNRLTPDGFDKATAPADVAVHGGAREDADFLAGEDRVRYSVDVGDAGGPFAVEAQLYYQPIAFRWAANLRGYDAPEPRRFLTFYDSMASASAHVLARAARATDP